MEMIILRTRKSGLNVQDNDGTRNKELREIME